MSQCNWMSTVSKMQRLPCAIDFALQDEDVARSPASPSNLLSCSINTQDLINNFITLKLNFIKYNKWITRN